MRHPKPFQNSERSDFGFSDLKKIFPQLLRFALPHKRLLIIGLLALGAASGINLFFPYFIREILNGKLGLSMANDLPIIVMTLIGLFFVQSLMFYIRHRSFASAGFFVVADLRRELFRALVNQDIAFFDRSRVGDLMSRLSSDTAQVQGALTVNISVAIRYILQVLGGIILMAFISPRLTLVIILLVPLLLTASRWWGVRLAKLSRAMQQQLGETAVVAEEALGSIRTVKMFAGSAFEESRYNRALERTLTLGIERSRFAALFSSAMVFVVYSAIALILWYGGNLMLTNALTVGDLTAFLLYCVVVAVSLGFLVGAFDDFFHAAGSGMRILELLHSAPTLISKVPPTPLPSVSAIVSNSVPHISFHNVTFAYPSRPTANVISDLTFSVPYGNTVAVVGSSGAGKSTVTALISRFYDPQSGVIRYGDVPLTDCDPNELREQISIVAQDVTVFSTSIRENVQYGRIGATDHEVEEVCRAANLHEFVLSLPQQYDTLVGDRGVLLSGGQKQRLAIARALLKDPKLLILDEATSALDSENEQLVQQALRELMRGRTTIIIAHRLSTVQHADAVLVLSAGQLIEQGRHEELVRQGGVYHSFVERQMLA